MYKRKYLTNLLSNLHVYIFSQIWRHFYTNGNTIPKNNTRERKAFFEQVAFGLRYNIVILCN